MSAPEHSLRRQLHGRTESLICNSGESIGTNLKVIQIAERRWAQGGRLCLARQGSERGEVVEKRGLSRAPPLLARGIQNQRFVTGFNSQRMHLIASDGMSESRNAQIPISQMG